MLLCLSPGELCLTKNFQFHEVSFINCQCLFTLLSVFWLEILLLCQCVQGYFPVLFHQFVVYCLMFTPFIHLDFSFVQGDICRSICTLLLWLFSASFVWFNLGFWAIQLEFQSSMHCKTQLPLAASYTSHFLHSPTSSKSLLPQHNLQTEQVIGSWFYCHSANTNSLAQSEEMASSGSYSPLIGVSARVTPIGSREFPMYWVCISPSKYPQFQLSLFPSLVAFLTRLLLLPHSSTVHLQNLFYYP